MCVNIQVKLSAVIQSLISCAGQIIYIAKLLVGLLVYGEWNVMLLSEMTSHYVIDQSMISICAMKKMFGCATINNLQDSTRI